MILFLGAYQDTIIFISYIWLLIIATFYLVGKFVLPIFQNFKTPNFKFTLGFFFVAFWFFYMVFPFYFPNINDKFIAIYNSNATGLNAAAGIVLAYYFTRMASNTGTKDS